MSNTTLTPWYLVVIDDMNQAEVWQGVKHLFPENGRGSRIIVTTSVNSVAAECSSGSYVYTMQGMGKDDSTKLLWEKVGAESQSRVLSRASEGILKKCDGLPLALISVANYLRRQGRASRHLTGGLTSEHCMLADRAFGDNILGGREAEFVKIMRTLTDWYDDLPDFVHQSCLLYVSVFSWHRPISCKALIQRWIAEGLVVADGTLSDEQVAPGCLDKLVDRNIIELVMTLGADAARCKVHRVMLEFIIQKSVSKNFTALVRNGECLRNKNHICRVRRLSVQYTSNSEVVDELAKDAELSAIRSLTIIRSSLFDFQKCRFLRVLDLDGCSGVDEDVVSAICKLLFLQYLSLRRTDIGNLPSELKRLRNLESLDIRQTRLRVLPREAIMLPRLAHVFGRFKLAPGIAEEAFKGCRLRTLAGAVVLMDDKNISFQQIILHARRLRKVKMYEYTSYGSSVRTGTSNKRVKRSCFNSQASTYTSPLVSLKKRFTGSNPIQTVSIDSKYTACQEFLSILEAPCAITSVKLRGKLESLPASPTLSQLDNLNKLKLFSTGQSCEDLSTLQILPSLEYLKLSEQRHGFWNGSFIVQSGGFPSLKRLCFEAPKLPEMQFRRGSMRFLAILDLLCPDPRPPPSVYFSRSFQTQSYREIEGQIGVEGISHLENLNEVVLHYSVSDIKIQAWKKEAVGHKNRPLVNRQPMPLPALL